MRKSAPGWIFIILAITVITAGIAVQDTFADSKKHGIIVGRILVNGEPVAGVRVSAFGEHTVTDADGLYRLIVEGGKSGVVKAEYDEYSAISKKVTLQSKHPFKTIDLNISVPAPSPIPPVTLSQVPAISPCPSFTAPQCEASGATQSPENSAVSDMAAPEADITYLPATVPYMYSTSSHEQLSADYYSEETAMVEPIASVVILDKPSGSAGPLPGWFSGGVNNTTVLLMLSALFGISGILIYRLPYRKG